MFFTCHSDLSPVFVLADSARTDKVVVSVWTPEHEFRTLQSTVFSFRGICPGGSDFFSLKASLESADFSLTGRTITTVITVTVACAVLILAEAVYCFLRDMYRAVRNTAIYLLDCLFRC